LKALAEAEAARLRAEEEAEARRLEEIELERSMIHEQSRKLLGTEQTGSVALLGNIGQDSESKRVPVTAEG